MNMLHFVHPFFTGAALGLVPLFDIMKNIVVNIGEPVSCRPIFSFFVGIDLGVELLGFVGTV